MCGSLAQNDRFSRELAPGDVPVAPGDVVTGDSHGVGVIPRRDAKMVLAKARAIAKAEEKKIAEIEAGQIIPGWLDETLKQKGCEILDEAWEK